MRNKGYYVAGIASIIGVALIIFILVYGLNACSCEPNVEENSYKVREPQNLVIELPDPTTYGSLTVLASDGTIRYACEGEIDILNDGKDGEPIEIRIDLPIEE